MDNSLYKSGDKRFGVSISMLCLKEIHEFCLQAGLKETGGILIGQYINNNSIAEVSVITGPPADSIMGRFNFERGIRGLKKILKSKWQVGKYYLGEWHFHPNSSSNPSSQDIRQLNGIAKSNSYHCPEPVMIIIGGYQGSFSEKVFISNTGKEVIELRHII